MSNAPAERLLHRLYDSSSHSEEQRLEDERRRCDEMLQAWQTLDVASPEIWASVPGRTELSGNHTDHQGGKVLAAAVDRDVLVCARKNASSRVRILSLGHGEILLEDLEDLEPKEEDRESSRSLVRGVFDYLRRHDIPVPGFNAVVHSRVGAGEGLSSSAAFTVLIGAIASSLGDERSVQSPLFLAQAAQYAEQVHFGKPCGLMDQLACAGGGASLLDFQSSRPAVKSVDFDLSSIGYALALLDTGSQHHDLTDAYAAVPEEMGSVAEHLLGLDDASDTKARLIDVNEALLRSKIPELRQTFGDRAVLRCLHFFDENRRVEAQAEALQQGDLDRYLRLMDESGRSSWTLLQNVVPDGRVRHQEVAMALALTHGFLRDLRLENPDDLGACRIHGGGFAGRIQILLPKSRIDALRQTLEPIFGDGSVLVTGIRQQGVSVESA